MINILDQYVYYGVAENYNAWQGDNCTNEVMMMQNTSPMETETVPQNDRYNYVYCNDNRMNTYPNQPGTILTPVTDSPMYSFPTNPMIEMYHSPPIYNQPISPLVYAQPETPAEPLTISLPMYSPNITYVYPQTATPTWYPHSINSHGFIFPTPVTPQNVANRY